MGELGRTMDISNGIPDELNCTEVEPDSVSGFQTVAPAISKPKIHSEPEPEPPTQEEQQSWAATVDKWLATEMGNGIPKDHVIPLLWNDKFGERMQDIESTDACTLVIKNADDGEQTHPITVIRLERIDEDPFEWVANDNFEYCPMSFDEPAEHIAQSALGVCQRAYWATDTEPEARSMRVLFPLGHTIEDMDPLNEQESVKLDAPHDPKRIVNNW